jgi:hypothetical protein
MHADVITVYASVGMYFSTTKKITQSHTYVYILYIYILSLSPNISLYHYLFGADLRAVLLKEYHVRPNPDAFHGPRKERDALGCR